MDTSHCHYQGYILLLVLLYSSMFDVASNIHISSDARGSKTDSNPKQYVNCGNYEVERRRMTVSCSKSAEYIITKINFADYGNPTGCSEEHKVSRHGNCGAPDTLRIVKKNCLGKHKCELYVSDEMFGPSHCKKDIKLIVVFTCTKA
ncbi:hypothetical protein F2Q69_00014819 [Brassica cretica]|uniref:SUEL-type lectin domain-containing protein n=1 Tax=Brassica cretica TaxID=69181 RepID=A0A8S9R1L5_BRACR|nr:hypothetical protein F2Q69_00014819 [Brassica cretica]